MACSGSENPDGVNTESTTTDTNTTTTTTPECVSNDQCASKNCLQGKCAPPDDSLCANDKYNTTIGQCDSENTFDLGGTGNGNGNGNGNGSGSGSGGTNNDKVSVDPNDGALVLDSNHQNNTYIWITDKGEGTVSKIDTLTKQEVARYRTGPLGKWIDNHTRGDDPSRTTVNLFGEAYVGNRDGNSVTKFSPLGPNCPDRNGDGIVTTHSAENIAIIPWDDDLTDGYQGDECVLWHTPLPATGGVRGMAAYDEFGLDGEVHSYVWVGSRFDSKVFKLDGDTGAILLSTNSPVQPYGFAMDQDGTLWISSRQDDIFGRIDTTRCTETLCPSTVCTNNDSCVKERITMPGHGGSTPFQRNYGITVDSKQRVWLAGNRVTRYDPSQPAGLRITQVSTPQWENDYTYPWIHGIAADAQGRIWGAGGNAGILQIDPETVSLIGTRVPRTNGIFNKGMAVDAQGKIWSVTQSSNALVYEPSEGDDGLNGTLDTTSVNFFTDPYTYSDMTGQQLALASHAMGFFRHTFDLCEQAESDPAWADLTWTADTPPQTRLSFRMRTANDTTALNGAPWTTIGATPNLGAPVDIATLLNDAGIDPGQSKLQIEARLERLRGAPDPNTTPRLYTFGVSMAHCDPTVL